MIDSEDTIEGLSPMACFKNDFLNPCH